MEPGIMTDLIAFELHEEWRNARKDEKGIFQPCWMQIKDEHFISELEENLPPYIRKVDDKYEMDIASVPFNKLSEDLKDEYIDEAYDAEQILRRGTLKTKYEIGTQMRKAWLDRNPLIRDSELGIEYKFLSKDEQSKYLKPYYIAEIMSQAKALERPVIGLDDVAKILENSRKANENVYIDFNGIKLFSMFDNSNKAYLKVLGKSKKQFEDDRKKWKQEYEKNEELEKEAAIKKIPEWIKRGSECIYSARANQWERCVKLRAEDLYHGTEVESALKIMEMLNTGATFEEAEKELDDNYLTLGIVLRFSKKGPAFFREVNKDKLNQKSLELLEEIEKQNAVLESRKTNKDLENERLAIKKTAERKIPGYIERGLKCVYKARQDRWAKRVKDEIENFPEEKTVDTAVSLMEMLNDGKDVEEVAKYVKDLNLDILSWKKVSSIVLRFSKKGPAFFKATSTPEDINYNIEKLTKIENENLNYAASEQGDIVKE